MTPFGLTTGMFLSSALPADPDGVVATRVANWRADTEIVTEDSFGLGEESPLAVTSWGDRWTAGNSMTLNDSNPPYYATGGLGGQPYARGRRNAGGGRSKFGTLNSTFDRRTFSLMLVGKWTGRISEISENQAWVAFYNNTTGSSLNNTISIFSLFSTSHTTQRIQSGSGTIVDLTSTDLTAGGCIIVRANTSVGLQAWYNGSLIGTDADVPSALTMDRVVICGKIGEYHAYGNDIYEIALWSDYISDSDIAGLTEYAIDRYSLP